MKQAFLITAYNNFEHLEKLIRILDSDAVFFYLYIDAKIKIPAFLSTLKTCNPIEVLHSRRVEWGDQSQILTELEIFSKAFENPQIEWFHLISGSDFPLMPINEILDFFEKADHADAFMELEPIPPHLAERVEIYHLMVKREEGMTRLQSFALKKIRSLQVKLGIKRKAPAGKRFMYGSNWVDLRRCALEALLNETEIIIRMTRFTSIANEVYKQTILADSGLRIINDNLRYIDWSARQPSPKSLTESDIEPIMRSGKLFARKFDTPESFLLREKIIERLNQSAM